MNIDVPQIFWHDDSASLMSIDFYPNSNYLITASMVADDDSGLRVSQSHILSLLTLNSIVLGI